jgi:hypothetical protein
MSDSTTPLGRQSDTDMAKFKFSRRELPGKLFAIAGALLLPERRSEVLLAPTKVQPKFKIGDFVAEDWLDEYDATATDFGQVLGMAYFQEAQQQYFEADSWVYYVNWISSTSETGFAYPTYDQEPSRECDLRLVKQLGGQK